MPSMSSLLMVGAWSIVGGSLSIVSVAAAQIPRACEVSDPPLAEGQDGVVPGHPAFIDDNGRRFEASIFGIGEADPYIDGPPYQLCMRYEFENGPDELQAFRWPDGGLKYVDPVPPGKRYRIPRKVIHSTRNVGPGPTELRAFESLRAQSRTVRPQRTITGFRTLPTDAGSFGTYEVGELLADLQEQFNSADASFDPVGAYYAPRESMAYPSLMIALQSDDFGASIESTARIFPHDGIIAIKNSIKVTGKRADDVSIYAPILSAMRNFQVEKSDSISVRTARFLGGVSDQSVTLPVSNGSYVKTVEFPLSSDRDGPALFLTEQLVTVRLGDWSACLIAQGYSPVPVELSGERYCQSE